MSKKVEDMTQAEKTQVIRMLCDKVRCGTMTLDEGVDYMFEHSRSPERFGRIDYVDFFWSMLGRPTDAELERWRAQSAS